MSGGLEAMRKRRTTTYIPPYAACGPGLAVRASAYIIGAGLPVRPSPGPGSRAPFASSQSAPTRAPVRRRRAVHALVEHLRHGPVVEIVVRSTLRVGVVAVRAPSPGFMCGRGGTAYGSSCVWKSAVLAA
jgi:hypothetical protein